MASLDYSVLVCLEQVLIHVSVCEICPGKETSAASLAADYHNTDVEIS